MGDLGGCLVVVRNLILFCCVGVCRGEKRSERGGQRHHVVFPLSEFSVLSFFLLSITFHDLVIEGVCSSLHMLAGFY